MRRGPVLRGRDLPTLFAEFAHASESSFGFLAGGGPVPPHLHEFIGPHLDMEVELLADVFIDRELPYIGTLAVNRLSGRLHAPGRDAVRTQDIAST